MRALIYSATIASLLLLGAGCVDDGAAPSSTAVVTAAFTQDDGSGQNIESPPPPVEYAVCKVRTQPLPTASDYGQCVACCQHLCDRNPPCASSCAKQACQPLKDAGKKGALPGPIKR